MFGLNLTGTEWAGAIGVAYLVLRVLYAIGLVIWWYITDARRVVRMHPYRPLFSGLAVGAMSLALLSITVDVPQNQLGSFAKIAAGGVGFFIGVAFDFILDFRLYNISTWLMSFRVPNYREQLLHSDAEVRLGAAQRLGSLGRYALPALPELFAAFKDESAEVRVAVVQAVMMMSAPQPPPEDDTETPKHTRPLLADPDLRVRVYAVAILVQFKAATPEQVLPALREALGHSDLRIADTAAATLYEMGPAAEPAISELRDSVFSRKEPNYTAISALGKIGAPAVPALIELLERSDPTSKSLVASTLAEMGDAARGALPALRKASAHPNAAVSYPAKKAIAKLGGDIG